MSNNNSIFHHFGSIYAREPGSLGIENSGSNSHKILNKQEFARLLFLHLHLQPRQTVAKNLKIVSQQISNRRPPAANGSGAFTVNGKKLPQDVDKTGDHNDSDSDESLNSTRLKEDKAPLPLSAAPEMVRNDCTVFLPVMQTCVLVDDNTAAVNLAMSTAHSADSAVASAFDRANEVLRRAAAEGNITDSAVNLDNAARSVKHALHADNTFYNDSLVQPTTDVTTSNKRRGAIDQIGSDQLNDIYLSSKGLSALANAISGHLLQLPMSPSRVAPAFTQVDRSTEEEQRINWRLHADLQQAQIWLNTKHLGPLAINITVNADRQIDVNFLTRSSVIKDALDQATPWLRDLLGQSGLTLHNANVQWEAESQIGEQQTRLDFRSFFSVANRLEEIPAAAYGLSSSNLVDFYA